MELFIVSVRWLGTLPTMVFDPEYVDISFEGRSLQLRMDQITVNNLAKTFRLIPRTVILVSTCGTVALPDSDGLFFDLDSTLSWTVEGDKSSHGSTTRPSQLIMQSTSLGSSLSQTKNGKEKERWKPTTFPSRSTSSRQVGYIVPWYHTLKLQLFWPVSL